MIFMAEDITDMMQACQYSDSTKQQVEVHVFIFILAFLFVLKKIRWLKRWLFTTD